MPARFRTSLVPGVDEVREGLRAVVYPALAACVLLIYLALDGLPARGPEPELVSENRKRWAKFEDAVLPLDQFQLRPGLVQVEASADRRRKGDRSFCLDGDVVNARHRYQNIRRAENAPTGRLSGRTPRADQRALTA